MLDCMLIVCCQSLIQTVQVRRSTRHADEVWLDIERRTTRSGRGYTTPPERVSRIAIGGFRRNGRFPAFYESACLLRHVQEWGR